VGSVHAHKYGFPFQQPSTSCGTYTTLSATYLIIILRYKNAILHILLSYRYIEYIKYSIV